MISCIIYGKDFYIRKVIKMSLKDEKEASLQWSMNTFNLLQDVILAALTCPSYKVKCLQDGDKDSISRILDQSGNDYLIYNPSNPSDSFHIDWKCIAAGINKKTGLPYQEGCKDFTIRALRIDHGIYKSEFFNISRAIKTGRGIIPAFKVECNLTHDKTDLSWIGIVKTTTLYSYLDTIPGIQHIKECEDANCNQCRQSRTKGLRSGIFPKSYLQRNNGTFLAIPWEELKELDGFICSYDVRTNELIHNKISKSA